MPLDPSYVGHSYPPSRPFQVCREKIREFATAIGDDNPVYLDPQAARTLGHPDVLAPPTFLTVLSFLGDDTVISDPGLGLDYSRVVHGEQRFLSHRPLYAGDTVVGVTSIDGIRAAGGNDILSTRTEVSTVEGEPVATLFATLVARGTAAGA